MKIIQLGRQGMAVGAQGLGCMGMSTTYGPSNEQESLATLARAIDLGVTLFDTAEVYGPVTNEALLGKAFKGRRDKVAIATKAGFEFTDDGKLAIVDGQPVVSGDPVHVRKAVEGSLGRLKTDYIDLLYLHRIDSNTPYRGRDRRARRSGERWQGALYRHLRSVGADDPQGARRPPTTPSDRTRINE